LRDEAIVDEERSGSERHAGDERHRRDCKSDLGRLRRDGAEARPGGKQEADTEGDAEARRYDRLAKQRDDTIGECRRQLGTLR
jgi:hypothetical protein